MPAGLLTQGEGSIQIYSQGSILLGLSRIMTTFGGDILGVVGQGRHQCRPGLEDHAWSTRRPSASTTRCGNVKLSPNVPSIGAGIATLDPIPEVPPGDVDLIAPLGTIDAGEAGIRVSGNVNLAALQVVNAANIQVKGESAGLPVVASVNVGALTNASAAASQAAMAAQDTVQRERARPHASACPRCSRCACWASATSPRPARAVEAARRAGRAAGRCRRKPAEQASYDPRLHPDAGGMQRADRRADRAGLTENERRASPRGR